MAITRNTSQEAVFTASSIRSEEYPLLIILALLQFTHIVDFLIILPLGPQLMRLLSISPQQFAILISSYSFGAAVFGIGASFLIDKFDRKHVLLVLLTLFTIGLMICSMATDYYSLLIGRIFTGAFGGNLGAMILAVVADSIPRSRCGTATGFVLSTFPIASIVGVPVGLYMASQTTWQVPYNILAIFTLIFSLIALFFLPPMKVHLKNNETKEKGKSLFAAYKESSLISGLIFMFLLIMGGFTVTSFMSPYLVSNLHFSEKELSYVYLIGGVAAFCTSHLAGKMIDKFGERKIFVISALVSIFAMIALTSIAGASKALVFIITTLFFTILNCRFISAMSMINSSVDSCKRGSFMELSSSVQQISCGIAAVVSGFLITSTVTGELNNYNLIGIIAAVSTFFSIFLSYKIKRYD
ncbi:MAG: MFS transporter [Cytophagaceae bacterium]|nr:MFS transporter [Cytophagaceae bacterium]